MIEQKMIKVGDFVEYEGSKYLVYNVLSDVFKNDIQCVSRIGDRQNFPNIYLKHLPECDSWDWQPRPDLEVDDKVLVAMNHHSKHSRRHFSHWAEDGRIACFEDGKTSWSIEKPIDSFSYTTWDKYKLPGEEDV